MVIYTKCVDIKEMDEQSIQECFVCFEKEYYSYSCCSGTCSQKICYECLEEYIEFLATSKNNPACVDPDCKGYYVYSDIPLGLREEFNSLVVEACKKTFVDGIRIELETRQAIDNIRKARVRFLRDKMPKSVLFVAKASMKKELYKLDRNAVKRIKELNKEDRRVINCPMVACYGSLDVYYQCKLCAVKVCEKCEMECIKDHKCKPEDIETVKFVKEMIHCPECSLPIEREYGCNLMTCANCDTNFDYSTGKKGGAGNHGQNQEIRRTAHSGIKLSNIHMVYLKRTLLLDPVRKIERYEPKKVKPSSIISIFTADGPLNVRKLLVVHERYSKYLSRYRLYMKVISDVENEIIEKQITRGSLETYLEVLERYMN